MRRRICAGNWKMHKTVHETVAYLERFAGLAQGVPANVELVICPPFTALAAAREALNRVDRDGRIGLGAQNMHWEAAGAFTGEISAAMLLDLGVRHVILGHSERRQHFGETDENVRRKTAAALHAGITPIVAVGESLELRLAGKTQPFVVGQITAALAGLTPEELGRIVIAYEPCWAIGTGHNCDPHEANAVMRAIRGCMDGLSAVPILYGGSVKPENIAQYVAQPDVDGGLVGGASLNPDGFATLAKEAA